MPLASFIMLQFVCYFYCVITIIMQRSWSWSSGLTHPEVSLVVFPGSLCLLVCSFVIFDTLQGLKLLFVMFIETLVAARAELRGGPSEQLSGAAAYKWTLRSHWNNRNCGTVNLRFSTHDRISPKIIRSQGTCPQNCSLAGPQAENVPRMSVSRGAKLLV